MHPVQQSSTNLQRKMIWYNQSVDLHFAKTLKNSRSFRNFLFLSVLYATQPTQKSRN
jgi:hypothetical protein